MTLRIIASNKPNKINIHWATLSMVLMTKVQKRQPRKIYGKDTDFMMDFEKHLKDEGKQKDISGRKNSLGKGKMAGTCSVCSRRSPICQEKAQDVWSAQDTKRSVGAIVVLKRMILLWLQSSCWEHYLGFTQAELDEVGES